MSGSARDRTGFTRGSIRIRVAMGRFRGSRGTTWRTVRRLGGSSLARHLAANAADVYGLRDRGRVAAGMAADICVIGPQGIGDRAIYGAPQLEATGVDLVMVNGVIVWKDARPLTTGFPGRFVG